LRPAPAAVILEAEAGVVERSSTFSTLQSIVALVAGVSSIAGGAYSAVLTFRADPSPGELVAVVRDAATARPVRAAVVEVMTPANVLVTTMTPGDDGLARRAVVPGPYRVRVVHPDFDETVRDVQVVSDGTAELHLLLARRPRSSQTANAEPPTRNRRGSAVDEAAQAVDRGIGAGRRLLGRIGF